MRRDTTRSPASHPWRTTCCFDQLNSGREFRTHSLPDGWCAVAVVVISVLTICATLVALFATGERAVRAHAVLIYLLDALRALFRCGGGKR
jgi:hypothetical protein